MIFLNELSFISQAADYQDCYKLMQKVRKILINLKPLSRTIYISENLASCEIIHGYNVKSYTSDSRINQIERQLFHILLTNNDAPYVENLLDSKLPYHECYLKKTMREVTSTSVAGAACFDGLLVSLQRTNDFQDDCIPVSYREDEREKVEKEILNLFDLQKTSIFVKEIIEKEISTFNDMWNKRKDLFPSLVFCDEVKSQFKKLNPSVSLIRNIIRHLKTMNDYMEKTLKQRNYYTRLSGNGNRSV